MVMFFCARFFDAAMGFLCVLTDVRRSFCQAKSDFVSHYSPFFQEEYQFMNIIETENLTKTYRRFLKPEGLKGSLKSLFKREYEEKSAVKNLNFELKEGEFIGLIGPNGAGKTTLTKMLTGIIAPTSGKIDVMGFYPNDLKAAFKQQYAVVMGQKSQLFMELTANDTLRLFKEIYGLEEKRYQETKEYFSELFGVRELMDVQVRTLSLGERMKMELMAALLHEPRLLFLDEPTIGLDAISSGQIRKFLKRINEEKGTSIILTSHYMEDISTLCKRSVVLHHGCKIYDGRTDELFARYQQNKKITAIFSQETGAFKLPDTAKILEQTPYKLVFIVPKEKSGHALSSILSLHPADISVEEDEIGTVVERIYREGSRYAG